GDGVATERVDSTTSLSVVDAIFTGTHEPGTSHHDLLAAFVTPETLHQIDVELDALEYRTHEFGDSLFIEKTARDALKGVPYRNTMSVGMSVRDALWAVSPNHNR